MLTIAGLALWAWLAWGFLQSTVTMWGIPDEIVSRSYKTGWTIGLALQAMLVLGLVLMLAAAV